MTCHFEKWEKRSKTKRSYLKKRRNLWRKGGEKGRLDENARHAKTSRNYHCREAGYKGLDASATQEEGMSYQRWRAWKNPPQWRKSDRKKGTELGLRKSLQTLRRCGSKECHAKRGLGLRQINIHPLVNASHARTSTGQSQLTTSGSKSCVSVRTQSGEKSVSDNQALWWFA